MSIAIRFFNQTAYLFNFYLIYYSIFIYTNAVYVRLRQPFVHMNGCYPDAYWPLIIVDSTLSWA